MRKIIVHVNATVDGYLSGPNGELDWMLSRMDPEMNQQFTDEMRARVDTILEGRNAYLGFEDNFRGHLADPGSPPGLIDFSRWMIDTPKVVFSRTLTSVSESSRLVTGDLAEEVAALKAQPGRDMVLFGGVSTVRSFVQEGLVDEYWIKLYPVALGSGQPLFADLKERADLELADSKAWDSGILTLRYLTS